MSQFTTLLAKQRNSSITSLEVETCLSSIRKKLFKAAENAGLVATRGTTVPMASAPVSIAQLLASIDLVIVPWHWGQAVRSQLRVLLVVLVAGSGIPNRVVGVYYCPVTCTGRPTSSSLSSTLVPRPFTAWTRTATLWVLSTPPWLQLMRVQVPGGPVWRHRLMTSMFGEQRALPVARGAGGLQREPTHLQAPTAPHHWSHFTFVTTLHGTYYMCLSAKARRGLGALTAKC
jgi:hypothetical protein